jgi:hypothetical protein
MVRGFVFLASMAVVAGVSGCPAIVGIDSDFSAGSGDGGLDAPSAPLDSQSRDDGNSDAPVRSTDATAKDGSTVQQDGTTATDASAPTDATSKDGSGTPKDGGVGPKDSATTPDVTPPITDPDAGQSCTDAIDVSAGGGFTFDTCKLADSITSTCAPTAAAAILTGASPPSGSTYSFTFPSNWVVQMVGSGCVPESGECGMGPTWGTSGAEAAPHWFWAFMPADGVCGTITVHVDRIM